jgi:5-(carboxyamino)imidazole ribonucleotide mutase
MFVPIILGSEKDQDHAAKITAHLDEFEIPYKVHVASAHKVPEKVLEIIKGYDEGEGPVCYITAAGRSNALSGFVAASSIYPVIGCPPFSDKADMLVNIHSTLQMPSNTPVLTVVDPQNAAMGAIRILAAENSDLRKKVRSHIITLKKSFNK